MTIVAGGLELMTSVSEREHEKPAKWERIYGEVISLLFAVVGGLLTWNVFSTSDWRTRSGYIFIVAWLFAVRGGGRWISPRIVSSVQNWRTAARWREFCFDLVWIGLPMGVFGYLVRPSSRWEFLTLIALMSLVPLCMWRPDANAKVK